MGKVIGIALIDRKGGPVVVHSSAKVTIEKGVGDDHRGRDVENKDRQVSVIAQEDWDIVCSELGTKLHWTTRKANIMVSGVDLVDSIGDVLKIGNLTYVLYELPAKDREQVKEKYTKLYL